MQITVAAHPAQPLQRAIDYANIETFPMDMADTAGAGSGYRIGRSYRGTFERTGVRVKG